ncbi:alpha/beta hydrolase [Calditerricola satsumensis]|uniref:Carboxylesterase n=1 Tax=Calditerricola satsumensis TaxID=373054 RepID=A0A8J3B863_9BACI|nr:alpha/beta fold hydrolase [Calditerricola satsumensis]GGK02556.1 carboxylesterase [Calditerricola satsumensis]
MHGCVLIHGFTGSPYEVAPLADHLAARGVRVYTPVLAGHEGSGRTLRQVTWQDWIRSAEDGLREALSACDPVDLVGFSMGGLIAAHLATRYPVRRLVLLSACVFYLNPRQLFRDVAAAIKSNFGSGYSKDQLRRYVDKVSKTPLRAVVHFRRLVQVLRADLARVEVPTLILQGACDDLVEPRSAQYLYETIPAKVKEVHVLPRSKHILCHDCEKDEVLRLVERFLLAPPASPSSGNPGANAS